MLSEIRFLFHLWKASLAAALEFRAAFLTQLFGMVLNDGVYFLVWVIFFDRFEQVRGWALEDMFVVFGITASAFGLIAILFGNAFNLAEIITGGRLDYYLSLPRPVLLHTLAGRMIPSGWGDFFYGFASFLASGLAGWDSLGRFLLGVAAASAVFLGYLIAVQSLAFWLGTGGSFTGLALNAIVTFAIYPITLFDRGARLVLFLVVPAAFMGAVPASFVHSFSWPTLGLMTAGAAGVLTAGLLVFRLGLRRYESGSAIQVEV